jgi:uncharacterized Tic20 family protein
MLFTKKLLHKPDYYAAEKACNSYLMSLAAMLVGMPIPFINLIATLAFFFKNRREDLFVRWHCTQALLSQIVLFILNTIVLVWLGQIIWGSLRLNSEFLALVITTLLFNLTEFAATIYTAIQSRKGIHVEWLFFGSLTQIFCRIEYDQSNP